MAAQGQHLAAQGNMHLKKFSVEEVGPIAFRNAIGPTLEYTFESFFDAFGDFLELGGHPGHPGPPAERNRANFRIVRGRCWYV